MKNRGEQVLEYFLELCKIPHGSGDEKRISDHLAAFAGRLGLSHVQDGANNVIVLKQGSPGLESAPFVILQAHMDMVCVAEGEYDFGREPILAYDDGEGFIRARGTSLGADDGVGVALIMAMLADKELRHPPLLALFTSDEERGLNGARALRLEDIRALTGSADLSTARLINIDEEQEGHFCGGCAGGLRAQLRLPVTWAPAPGGHEFFELAIGGLTSGHSGICIDEGRANANRLLARTLGHLAARGVELTLADIAGGDRENAIPAWATAVVGVPESGTTRLWEVVGEITEILRREYNHGKKPLEPGLAMGLTACAPPERVFAAGTRDSVVAAGLLLPDGVLARDVDDPALVETSSNMGVLRVEKDDASRDGASRDDACGDQVSITSAVRSSADSRKYFVLGQMETLAACLGGAVTTAGDYPGWMYRRGTPLKELFTRVYREKYGVEPQLAAIHAGLECGQLAKLFGEIDMIAFGPTIHDVHTTKEKLEIASVANTAEFLAAVLRELG